ncbi:helix-turn-helix domain-containing protein [Streptomyces sp. NEAU-174]|uniref:helix-turn-helix domain-containing protein n=1 Tax=Streptomyces sp. NEAU-174 TaxID=3458254 RepID=UPI004043A928
MTSRPPKWLGLSAREREAVQLMALGMTRTESATKMGVCTARVNCCLKNAAGKLRTPTWPGLVDRVYTLREIDPPESTTEGASIDLTRHHVLRGLADGRDLPWIAANSGLTVDTVREEARTLISLTDAKNTENLIHRGWELGLLGSSPTASAMRSFIRYDRINTSISWGSPHMTAQKLEDLPKIPPRKRLTGKDRENFRKDVSSVYKRVPKVSVRDISEVTGRSFGFIRTILLEAGIEMHSRGSSRGLPVPSDREAEV